jgi:predicted dienelactone hydrolase
MTTHRFSIALGLLLASCMTLAKPSLGVTELAPNASQGALTLFYPSAGAERTERIGNLSVSLAREAAPLPGNGRLVLISHGSGGSAWVHSVLARRLVEAGFVVAAPSHVGDRFGDVGDRGPVAWARRPRELSQAVDRLAAEPLWAARLRLDRVGVWGMSAGGHTALSMAGGRWSPQRLLAHCRVNLTRDFHACAGLASELTGGWLDQIKQWAALGRLRWHFGGPEKVHEHRDPRIAAVVATVPAAADFDASSLANPPVALALVGAAQDRWLRPEFHSERILARCLPRCERLADLLQGGHGALLNPLPAGISGLEGKMLNDPPGFDRRDLVDLDQKTVAFFVRHLGVVAAN